MVTHPPKPTPQGGAQKPRRGPPARPELKRNMPAPRLRNTKSRARGGGASAPHSHNSKILIFNFFERLPPWLKAFRST
jgi:hypothetical protein